MNKIIYAPGRLLMPERIIVTDSDLSGLLQDTFYYPDSDIHQLKMIMYLLQQPQNYG